MQIKLATKESITLYNTRRLFNKYTTPATIAAIVSGTLAMINISIAIYNFAAKPSSMMHGTLQGTNAFSSLVKINTYNPNVGFQISGRYNLQADPNAFTFDSTAFANAHQRACIENLTLQSSVFAHLVNPESLNITGSFNGDAVSATTGFSAFATAMSALGLLPILGATDWITAFTFGQQANIREAVIGLCDYREDALRSPGMSAISEGLPINFVHILRSVSANMEDNKAADVYTKVVTYNSALEERLAKESTIIDLDASMKRNVKMIVDIACLQEENEQLTTNVDSLGRELSRSQQAVRELRKSIKIKAKHGHGEADTMQHVERIICELKSFMQFYAAKLAKAINIEQAAGATTILRQLSTQIDVLELISNQYAQSKDLYTSNILADVALMLRTPEEIAVDAKELLLKELASSKNVLKNASKNIDDLEPRIDGFGVGSFHPAGHESGQASETSGLNNSFGSTSTTLSVEDPCKRRKPGKLKLD